MEVLHWGHNYETFSNCLKKHPDGKTLLIETEHLTGLAALQNALAVHRAHLRLVVLAPLTSDELTLLLDLGLFLSGLAVIVVLPPGDGEMHNKVHRLHPRFVASGQNAWDDAVSVAVNILRKSESRVST
ncbi:MAG TPA: hypothetical protein PKH07_15655 [bacterium]|nr:hypothetical protein [bacterium]